MTTSSELALMAAAVHDRWFDVEDLEHDAAREELRIPIHHGRERGRLIVTARPPVEPLPRALCTLVVRQATSVNVIDEAQVGWYDINDIVFNGDAGELSVIANVPCTVIVQCRQLDVELQDHPDFGDQPEIDDFTKDVLRVVHEALTAHESGAATVSAIWSGAAGMWFVEVAPRNRKAAAVSIGVDGDELLLTFGKTRCELWRGTPSPTAKLADYLGAIFTGEFEEAGHGNDRFVRGRLPSGKTFRCGAMHLPIPWALRRTTAYEAY